MLTVHGTGDNVINGLGGNDTLEGGGGADSLDGGTGIDFARYSAAVAGIVASLTAPASNTGEAAGDTYTSIEGLIGTNLRDTLSGDGGANELQGLDGNDTIYGFAGADRLFGGNNDDDLTGGTVRTCTMAAPGSTTRATTRLPRA